MRLRRGHDRAVSGRDGVCAQVWWVDRCEKGGAALAKARVQQHNLIQGTLKASSSTPRVPQHTCSTVLTSIVLSTHPRAPQSVDQYRTNPRARRSFRQPIHEYRLTIDPIPRPYGQQSASTAREKCSGSLKIDSRKSQRGCGLEDEDTRWRPTAKKLRYIATSPPGFPI